MAMDVTFLGTGSAYPSPCRGASALVLRTEGETWLFDCGEGTQTQLMKSPIRTSRIKKVFISHLHGDHMFGLPGLLCSMSLGVASECDTPLEVFGPCGLRLFLRVALQLSGSQLMFPYVVHELEASDAQCPAEARLSAELTGSLHPLHPQERPGTTLQAHPVTDLYTLVQDHQDLQVTAFKLVHRVASFGFSVEERQRPGKLNTDLLKQLGNRPAPCLDVKEPSRTLSGPCLKVIGN